MYWLPVKLPPGVKVIISTKSSDTENIQELVKERQYTQIEIPDLNLESQKELCEVLYCIDKVLYLVSCCL